MALEASYHVPARSAWRGRFYLIWTGQAISLFGSRLVQFALIWYLTVETGSARVLAAASLAGLLPGVFLGPFVGALVDRWNRRRMMLLADGVTAAATGGLAVFFFLGSPGAPVIYALLFIRGLSDSFHGNAMAASMVLLVPPERLTRVQGLQQMLNGVLNIASAPLGALLLALTSMQYILLIDVATAVTAILPLLFVSIPQPRRTALPDDDFSGLAVLRDFREGLNYIRSRRGLLIISLMTVGINLTIIPAFSLLPLLVKDYFGGTAIQLGWVESALGVGILLGGGVLGAWGGFRRRITTALLGLMGMGVGALVIAAAPASALPVAVVGVLLAGIMNSLTMGPFIAVLQATVPPGMQARVLALLSSIGAGMTPLGLLAAGPISDHLGIHVWFMAGGVLCVFMGFTGLLVPAVMTMEDSPEIDPVQIEKECVG